MLARRGILRRRVPAERPRTALRALPLGKMLNYVAGSKNAVLVLQRVLRPVAGCMLKNLAGKSQKVRQRWRKARHGPPRPSSTQAFSSCTSPWMRRWRKLVSSSVGGIDVSQTRGGAENRLMPCRVGERFRVRTMSARYSRITHFKRLAEQNESGVGVFGARTRLGLERQLQAGAKKRFRRGRGAEKLHVSRQARVVGQQMPAAVIVRAGSPRSRPTTNPGSRSPSGVSSRVCRAGEQHRRGCCCDYLRQAGYVEDGLRASLPAHSGS